ncbi:MAG TPA: hypothetical protein VLT91_06725 [Rhizomicrobium sp.]|nr:hypothetical protein [Rhizomicrobium sp.]
MPLPELRADCARCAALCCVALAFDRSSSFAFDKKAGEACRHLAPDNRCAVHDVRAGMSGCAAYDCLGAGQRVVQELFGGSRVRSAAMFDAFRAMRLVHELLLLLREAARLPLSRAQAAQRDALERALTPDAWTRASLSAFERGLLPAEVRAFLRTLAPPGRVIARM